MLKEVLSKHIVVSLFWEILSVSVAAGLLMMSLLNPSAIAGLASTSPLLQLTEASLSLGVFRSGAVEPLISYNGLLNREPDKQLDLNVNLALLRVLYVNNTVHALTDRGTDGTSGMFRLVGWHYQIGLHLCQFMDVYVDHFSQHLLDTTYAFGHPPTEDSIGVKMFFYRTQEEKGALF